MTKKEIRKWLGTKVSVMHTIDQDHFTGGTMINLMHELVKKSKLSNHGVIGDGLGYVPGDTPTTDPIQKIIYGGREYILNN